MRRVAGRSELVMLCAKRVFGIQSPGYFAAIAEPERERCILGGSIVCGHFGGILVPCDFFVVEQVQVESFAQRNVQIGGLLWG